MLELSALDYGIVVAHGAPDELARARVAADDAATVLRVAADELMFVAAPGSAAALVGRLAPVAGPDALVVDASDGWCCWALAGDTAAAFSYLSEVPLPDEGSLCGEVARVPVRVLVRDGRHLELFVPVMWRRHVRERILTDCAPMEPTEVGV